MSDPIVLSDGDDPNTPRPSISKKPRTEPDRHLHPVLILDDDPTPQKPSLGAVFTSGSTPSFVAETPMSEPSFVGCSNAVPSIGASEPQLGHAKFSGISRLICLESDNDSDTGSKRNNDQENGSKGSDIDESEELEWRSRFFDYESHIGSSNLIHMCEEDSSSQPLYEQDDGDHLIFEVNDDPDKENFSLEQMGNAKMHNQEMKANAADKKITKRGATVKNKMTKEERTRMLEEKKLKKEQEKLQKAALKAEAAELKKLQKERQKWEKGKFALKSIVAEIDTKVVELGSIGGHLLSRFADKGLTYHITSNPIEKSIAWTMTVPEHISQIFPEGLEIQYVLIVCEAAEFCDLVTSGTLLDHVSRVRSKYSSYTVCYLTNRLMAYINKRENEHYKNPAIDSGWRHPPVEEELAKLTAYYARVHSRQCADESELAEHVVGLTCSLASCQFRKKLTRLSVSANGSLIPKDSIDKNLIKGNLWLKALLAIPKVQPRFALAIGKKYPTMKSLLRVYMDPTKSVHEKEFLLKDLLVEGLVGNDRRLGEICSKRVYRVLIAQSGSIKTDDIEDGADFFAH
ncbi:crossover junction endonuclease EME1B-like isoform X2 [Hibiscus syriacus]|uniref:crossover junction endonuclease EME1B-like isoform X2 n=1 Tax=Hibiscus syriacus TaxID=106335 RepID=UPI00192050C6|nr:crossover junction endonuclease EME1B-like isoform X2 [Hibiscus syriacus]